MIKKILVCKKYKKNTKSVSNISDIISSKNSQKLLILI